MLVSAANQSSSEILFKTYSYSNGKMEENVVYKKDCAYASFDKLEISKDSPEYEAICSQMRSVETYGVNALGNTLFYEANEITTEYGAEPVDFDSVVKNTKYTLAGGLSFNGVWNWRQWDTSYVTAQKAGNILEKDFVPPKDFIYCSGTLCSSSKNVITEEDIQELIGKGGSDSLFRFIFEQNSSHSFNSLLLDKNNWRGISAKESFTRETDILKNFHMEHYRNNRFEFLWMGDKN